MREEEIGKVLAPLLHVLVLRQLLDGMLEDFLLILVHLGEVVVDVGDHCIVVECWLQVHVGIPGLDHLHVVIVHEHFIQISLKQHSASLPWLLDHCPSVLIKTDWLLSWCLLIVCC